eukprot:678155-Pelagomonas_calceolata.AAC.2
MCLAWFKSKGGQEKACSAYGQLDPSEAALRRITPVQYQANQVQTGGASRKIAAGAGDGAQGRG